MKGWSIIFRLELTHNSASIATERLCKDVIRPATHFLCRTSSSLGKELKEENPEQQHLLLQYMVDSSVDGILAFDTECRYTAWNRAMEKISGLKREQVIGRFAFEVFPFLKQTGEDKFFYEA